jgi:hypothetical protein
VNRRRFNPLRSSNNPETIPVDTVPSGNGAVWRDQVVRRQNITTGASQMKARIVGGMAGIGVLAWALVGPPSVAQRTATWPLSIGTISAPAASNSGEPQLTVSDRGVLLSWIEHDGPKTTLRFAERTASGWTEARTVAAGRDWSVNPIDVPSVLHLADGTLVAHWLQRSGAGMHANDVRLSYSKDDGRSWAPSFTPYHDAAQKERLFASLFQVPGAGLGLVWLEGNAMPAATGTAERTTHDHSAGGDHARRQPSGQRGHEAHGDRERSAMSTSGEMSLRFASFDTGWKLTAQAPVDLRVCECCSTAAVATSEGVLAAYRDRSEDEVRDISVSRLAQGRWSEPAVVHADNWRIPACPINGPALSARGRNVAIAWYTVKQDQGHVYLAFSRDDGRSFGQPIRLDDSASLGRVDVEMLSDNSALATWIEVADGRSQFRARRVSMDGQRSPPVTIAGLAGGRAGGSPRVARHGDELVFAWTESSGDKVKLQTAVARLSNPMR